MFAGFLGVCRKEPTNESDGDYFDHGLEILGFASANLDRVRVCTPAAYKIDSMRSIARMAVAMLRLIGSPRLALSKSLQYALSCFLSASIS
jgi:hypothetical protein